jgi:hypothetical protein
MISSHERYRDALSVLADDSAILPIVSTAGERRGWWTSERIWRRTYSRFNPNTTVFADIVFASQQPSPELCRIEMLERQPDDGPLDAVFLMATDPGWARVTRFPFDPALPALQAVAAGASVVRYHPGRRCTLRAVAGERGMFAKVYATDRGRRVYDDLVGLQRARSRGELQMAIAVPLSWDASSRTLWQAALPGCPASGALRAGHGEDLARRMGMAAGSLARARVQPSAVLDGTAALARTRRHAGDLVQRVPDLAGTVGVIVDELVEIHDRYSTRDPRPVHGAPHPDQWLVDASGLGLIDFDRFSRGDPESDAGVMLADLAALDEPAVPAARLGAAFLEGYRAAGVVLREPLVQAYCAHRQLAKALRAAQAIRPDGDRRAGKAVVKADRMLREAVPA